MSDEKITLYRISFFDLMLIIATSGLWALWVFYFNAVEVDAPVEDA